MNSSQPHKASFIRVPKTVLEYIPEHKLTPEAVLLYSLMLDRSSLSRRNGAKWIDEHGHIFVFCTISTIQHILSCGHDKATRLVRELASAGLITISPQGPGKPRRIIVHPVADFTSGTTPETSAEPLGFSAENNTELSDTVRINTDSSTTMTGEDIAHQIKANVEYNALLERWPAQDVDNLIRLMVDTLYPQTKTISISGVRRSYQTVFDRLMQVGQMEFTYVLDRLQHDAVQIRSMRSYILMLLYEAPAVSDFYYSTKLNYDEARR